MCELWDGTLGSRKEKEVRQCQSRTPEARRKHYLSVQKKCNQRAQALYKAKGLCAQCGKRKKAKNLVVCILCRDRTRKNGKAYRDRLRSAAYDAYGGASCRCCGDDHLEFLTLDHINGGGGKHREQVGTGDKIHRWLRDNNYPPGFRVLCFNCNYAEFRYGRCPHRKKRGKKKK